MTTTLTLGGQRLTLGGSTVGTPDWNDFPFANSWDVPLAKIASGRVEIVDDPNGGLPLRRFPTDFAYLGDPTAMAELGPLRGPKFLHSSPRFNGRAAMVSQYTGRGPATGASFHIWSGLTPNNSPDNTESIGHPDFDHDIYFNPPDGYDPPYWLAVLGRAGLPDDPEGDPDNDPIGVWDATHGGKGTGPTVGGKIVGLGAHNWQFSTFGPGLVLVSTTMPCSVNDTVLVFVHVTADGTNSFIEVNRRLANGVMETQRVSGSMLAWQYYECFFGWVHGQYVSAAGIGLGIPDEDVLDDIRRFASYWIPPSAVLPDEG